jgi:tRNA pseudouridine13 synthase
LTDDAGLARRRAHGLPLGTAVLKSCPEDFVVDERVSWQPDGDGSHCVLRVEKRGCNTGWVAGQLARIAGCAGRDVGYAGMKDRNAVTRQWFSVPAGGAAGVDWATVAGEGFRVLEWAAHRRKLRRGALAGNDFDIVLRGIGAPAAAIDERLGRIARDGVPNYFGAQRFGRGGANLRRARDLLIGNRRMRRNDRAFAISAARSLIFNDCLAERVRLGNWDRALDGELVMLDGTHSVFVAGANDAGTAGRVSAHDLHPTGPMWGRGEPVPEGAALALEQRVVAAHRGLADGLERAGAEMQRRCLRVVPDRLSWSVAGEGELRIRFGLPPGAYATEVLSELFELTNPDTE